MGAFGDEFGGRENWRPPAWARRHGSPSREPEDANARAVLVVDDEEAVRASVADVLRTVGYTVIEAADGEDALRLLTTMRFDAMVLDLKMPRRDGVSLLGSLTRPPPVVLLSAHDLDEQARRRVGTAIVTYLQKPVPPQRLLHAVAAAVGLQRPS